MYDKLKYERSSNIMNGRIHSIETFGTVDGPGTRLVIFFQGCPMRCKYCHNPDTWEMNAGTEMTSDEIIEKYESNKVFYTNGGITVTGGEPLMQIDFLIELFEKSKKKNIHTCIDTSGISYNPGNPSNNDKMDRLIALTDLVMLDIKHINPEEHIKLTEQPNDGILAFAKYLDTKNVDIWIRHVVVPGITDDPKYLHELGLFIGQLKNLKALDVLPYHDMGKAKYEQLGMDYVLKDVKPMSEEGAIVAKKVIIDAIKEFRNNDN